MRSMLSKFKKHQQVLFRGIIFLCLVYLIVPSLLQVFIKDKAAAFTYNLFSFPAFTLVVFALFAVFNREILLEYKDFPKFKRMILLLFFSLGIFALYYFTSFNLKYTMDNYSWLTLLSWSFYLSGIVLLALALFGFQLFKKTHSSLIVLTLITVIFFTLTNILNQLWKFMAFAVAKIVYFFLHLFSDTAKLTVGNGDPTIGLEKFSVIIGPPCSGIESLSMFIGLFLLLIVYDWDSLIRKRTGIIFLLGLVGTFFLNILRMSLILLIGTKYPHFALNLFHSHVGWILFSVFMLALLYFGYGWMIKKQK